MYNLRFYVLFYSISLISGQWEGDNEDCVNEIPFAAGKIFDSVAQKEITSQTDKYLVILSLKHTFLETN